MRKNSSSRFLFIAALVLLLVYGIMSWRDAHHFAGWCLMGAFVSLALALQGYELLRGYSYPVMIFAAVSLAMYYPQYFVEVQGFKLSKLIVPLLQIIMFGMGTALSWRDFARVLQMPRGVFIGIVAQYTIMPFVGWGITRIFPFPPEVAAGIILIGSCPSGLASNVMSYLARANVALSVTLTAVATLLAPVVTPFYMQWLGGEYVDVNFWSMMWDIVRIIIIPIGVGLIFNLLLHGKFPALDRLMPVLSMAGIAVIIVVITAAGRNSLLVVGPLLILATLLHNVSGYVLGYWSSRALRLPEQDCRTVALEVGLQNGGLASGLALEMGKLATVGLAPAIFGPLMNITGSSLALWWRSRGEAATHQEEVPRSERTVGLKSPPSDQPK